MHLFVIITIQKPRRLLRLQDILGRKYSVDRIKLGTFKITVFFTGHSTSPITSSTYTSSHKHD